MSILEQAQCLHCGNLSTGSYCCSACKVLHGRFQKEQITADPQFVYLDQENFRNLYQFHNSNYNYQLFIEGLHCSSCVHLLEKLPEYDDSILEARLQFGQSRLCLKTQPHFSLSHLSSLLQSWGYKSHFLTAQDGGKENLALENRRMLKQLAVAGACAGNIMMFSIPVYSGLAGNWAISFNWMGFLLFLPLLFYSSQSFYRGAWNSLLYQKMNVDLPIVIALWGGFLMSTFNLLRNDGAIYFDSTASFIFLILCARYLLKRVQQDFLKPLEIQDFFQAQHFEKVSDMGLLSVPISSIQANDVLFIQEGQTLPADSVLISKTALLDLSMLNGESLPRYYHQGMELVAGAKVIAEKIKVRVINLPEQSKLASLLKKINETSLSKIRFVGLTDRISHFLILVVFSIAGIFFATYANINFQEAFNRSLALIVLACPCALAFGSPLTIGLALKKAQGLGILIKNGNVLEKILKVKNVFFDKTGTLTDSRLQLLHTEPSVLSEETKSIILGLEQGSHHPISFCLRALWQDSNVASIENCVENISKGISGNLHKDRYEIRTLSENVHSSSIAIVLLKNTEQICCLYFEDPLRPSSKRAIQHLTEIGVQSFLLSGDRKIRTHEVAKECGINHINTFAELFPDDKKEIISKYQDTCMIGDGANDSLALKQADVGIAVQGSIQMSLQTSDVYFTRGGLDPLLDLWKLAQQTRRVLVRNLTFSLVYNSVGAALALTGYINPLLAAILMPISSVLIVLSTLWGFRGEFQK